MPGAAASQWDGDSDDRVSRSVLSLPLRLAQQVASRAAREPGGRLLCRRCPRRAGAGRQRCTLCTHESTHESMYVKAHGHQRASVVHWRDGRSLRRKERAVPSRCDGSSASIQRATGARGVPNGKCAKSLACRTRSWMRGVRVNHIHCSFGERLASTHRWIVTRLVSVPRRTDCELSTEIFRRAQ